MFEWLRALLRWRTVPAARPAAQTGRRMSARGVDWLKSWEGFRERPYLDAAGVLTWGYGHAQRPGEYPPDVMTPTWAHSLLEADLYDFEAAVGYSVMVPLVAHEFDALVAFAFNCGRAAFERSTLLRKLNAGDKRGAAAEFERWIHAGGSVLPGLVRRRAAERDMFVSAVYRGP